MSIEIDGFDSIDRIATSEVSYLAGRLCVAQGIQPDQACIVGERAAQYSGELIFATLRQMDTIDGDNFDTELFVQTARSITEQSGVEI